LKNCKGPILLDIQEWTPNVPRHMAQWKEDLLSGKILNKKYKHKKTAAVARSFTPPLLFVCY